MKVAAIVGVKDECDLIQPCLERLWAVGVGPILVLDDHSVDGTRDVVDRLADRGLLDAEFEAQRMGESEMNRLVDLGAIERADAVLEKSVRTNADH